MVNLNLVSLVLSLSSLSTLALAGVVPRQASSSITNYGSSTGSTSTSITQVGSDVNANPYPTGTMPFETIAPSVTFSTNLTTTATVDIATASASGGVAASTTGSTSITTSTATSTLHLTPAYNNTPSTSTGNNHNGNDADTDTEADNSDGGDGELPVKYYDFTVTWGDVDANGEIRPAILVNGQTPGPLIELEEGQRVSVSTEVPRPRGFEVSRLRTNGPGCQVRCWLTTILCVRGWVRHDRSKSTTSSDNRRLCMRMGSCRRGRSGRTGYPV
jgi:hypothetical protein